MAKRFRNIFQEVATFENLYLALRKAMKGKRGKPSVSAFEYDAENQLVSLQEELLSKEYRPGPYKSFYIQDPKRRLISAAPFRDRVVHHALCNVIEPIFERTFIGDSYANRRGKGTHKAIERAQSLARGYRFVLRCDLRQFFPSVDHEILRGILARKLDDPGVLWLVDLILAGGEGVLEGEYAMVYFPGDDLFAVNRPRGLPIGNLTSQFWSNVYLNELDQFVKRRLGCRGYVRFADDFLFFGDRKRQLWEWKDEIREVLGRLRLTLHERESTVHPVTNGIPFLGFTVFPDRRRLRRRNGVAFARRLRSWYRVVGAGEMSVDELFERIRGWIAHARHGDTYGLRKSLLRNPIPLPGTAASGWQG